MIELIRGIRTPLLTTSSPASFRPASNASANLASRSRIRNFRLGAGVFQVHDQVPPELRGPAGRGVRGSAEDPNAPGGVLDDGEGVQARPGQGAGLEEVTGQQGVGLTVQEADPGRALGEPGGAP
jgi:hypothetical protein